MTKKEQIAEFLARNGATKCPPATTFADQATPLARARREQESRLMSEPEPDIDHEVAEREQAVDARNLELMYGKGDRR